jgi:hypothetical protein
VILACQNTIRPLLESLVCNEHNVCNQTLSKSTNRFASSSLSSSSICGQYYLQFPPHIHQTEGRRKKSPARFRSKRFSGGSQFRGSGSYPYPTLAALAALIGRITPLTMRVHHQTNPSRSEQEQPPACVEKCRLPILSIGGQDMRLPMPEWLILSKGSDHVSFNLILGHPRDSTSRLFVGENPLRQFSPD